MSYDVICLKKNNRKKVAKFHIERVGSHTENMLKTFCLLLNEGFIFHSSITPYEQSEHTILYL